MTDTYADHDDADNGTGIGTGSGSGTGTEVTEGLVRELLREQHPDLAGLAVREVVGGWGNQMWRLGDELAVRVQRMDPTPEPQLKERRWLPVLAPRLPLPVPVPVRSGEPSARFPKHWTVMTWVPGEPLDHGSISRGAHAADTLAGFLRALHVEAPADAPVSRHAGARLGDGAHGFEESFRAVVVPDAVASGVRAVWDDAVAAGAWEGPPVWVHGDLHPANVVVSDGTLSGVIDFGDVFAGDPAWDLAAAWVLLPEGAASRFFDAYFGTRADADEATIRRARGLAALKSLFLMRMGQNGDRGLPGGKPHWGPLGRAALDRVLTGA
ncbi:aminoglycoside phosphotransferase family protein [Streptomyces sp. J2-1]|uniref:aminoglycoside phosphotransferase family protein n=1 Tax=Streptomyces corallincola TaxID=2851888 RepID=UPI001C391E88|nr:aminoglycoside phosphotransferase family protein [Streptomyces corallincola]MBV2355968.1 aminoglycoside phosphotransferase family protein [Streptomyces corallincola]